MLQRTLPGTDLSLSVVGMGCWTIGGTWWGPDQDDARAVRAIHAAWDAGVNWFDTAPLYGDGHADRLLARALQGRPDALVATKVGARMQGEHAISDLRPEAVVADCAASLQRLGRDRIDLLQVHWPCQVGAALEDTLGALIDLRERGWIRHFGLCNYGAVAVAHARSIAPLASLQAPLSLLRREAEGALLAEAATPRGDRPVALGVLAYETLCRGLLTGRFDTLPTFDPSDQRARDDRFAGRRFAHARALVADLTRVAAKVDCSVAALAVGWALQRPGVTAAVVGARTPEQIRDSATAADLLGRRRLWSVVDRIAAMHGGS